MSGDGAQFEYPDEAGYPDGTGTLHEGTDGDGGDAGSTDAVESELDDFAMQDEEDVDGD
ncbi:hypothetical protein ACWKWP_03215 [Agromyces soli]